MKLFDRLTEKTNELFVEIRGRSTLLTEGYCQIQVYSPFEMVLGSQNGTIAVFGEELRLRHLSAERIAIDGRIDKVEFI